MKTDLAALGKAADQTFLVPRLIDDHMARRYPLLFEPRNAHRLLVATRGAQLIGHAGLHRVVAQVGGNRLSIDILGAVFVVPAFQGRGLGSKLLHAALALSRRNGGSVMVATGTGPLYTRAGFRPLHGYKRYTARSGRGFAVDLDLQPLTTREIPTLMALARTEPICMRRTTRQWQASIDSGIVHYDPGGVWLLRRQGRAVAAVAVARGTGRAGRIVESFGDRAVVAEALSLMRRRLRLRTLVIWVAPWDRGLRSALACGASPTPFRPAQTYRAVTGQKQLGDPHRLPYLGCSYV